jgi:ABC-type phosphate/phosphonate transport system substrate-binding protein
VNTVTVGPFPISEEQKENWQILAKYYKRSLTKQVAFEMDASYTELEQNLLEKQ